ncbi:phosphate signaling complex protein PhoU [Amycolatopsis speibonae]|uniref:Phosphate-specific transport system accessory protein PhoU n=1 Tax=Amycolatopsis speibonae TaxID=1450224 RepID=A0ABV7P0N8_9PSEU
MRETFHDELAQLGAILADMCAQAAEAMRQATQALLTADLDLAEQVLSADAELDAQRGRCESEAYSLLALQAPVATDLRTVLAVIYCAEKIERMGDLAAHVADTARYSHPEHAVPAELKPVFSELGAIAAQMACRVAELIRATSNDGFAELADTDQTVDALHAQVLATITGDRWPHGPRPAATLALATRFYERFADQAVSVAKRLEFAHTGALPDNGR